MRKIKKNHEIFNEEFTERLNLIVFLQCLISTKLLKTRIKVLLDI